MWDKKSVNYQPKNLLKLLMILLLFLPFGLSNPVKAQSQQNTKLLPFFDNVDNPVPVGFPPAQKLDISPPAPKLNSFDLAILKTSGPIGTRVQPNQFKQLLSQYPDVVEKLQQVTGGQLRPGRRSKSDFISDLTDI